MSENRLIAFQGEIKLFSPGLWTNFSDMRKRFLYYLIAQVVVILAVMAIFKVISPKEVAATVAGFLFVLVPAVLLGLEIKISRLYYRGFILGVLQFWIIFALPILGIRLFNWGVPFAELSFWGIPGPLLHQWSSRSYMLMMLVTAFFAYKNYKESQG